MTSSAKYDREVAIRKATNLFWAKGFHATSMRNIQQAMDMRPGSIYASFGSKEALFKLALQCYLEQGQRKLEVSVFEAGSPLAGLKQFVEDAVLNSNDLAPSGMCMLVKTISELTEEHADLLAEARRLLKKMEQVFASVLHQAQAAREIDQDTDCDRLARYLQMQFMGLRAYARATEDHGSQLQDLIDDTFAVMCQSKECQSC